jgi:GNAT superfamily N-acetyltransferase
MRIRPARDADAEAIAAIVIEGDETLAEFAPPEWQPPSYEAELRHARDGIAMTERWIAVAEVDGEIAGYAAVVAAALTRAPVNDPALAHLGRLFVRPPHWGTGVATALHAAAIAAASDQGFAVIRLFTPTWHRRARRFYEREGWQAVADLPENELGMPLTEYRRELAVHRR